jgi:hypothetical protein
MPETTKTPVKVARVYNLNKKNLSKTLGQLVRLVIELSSTEDLVKYTGQIRGEVINRSKK